MKLANITSVLHRNFLLLIFLVSMAGTSQRVLAQTTASLSGSVQDTTGAIIPNAHVVLTNTASQDKRSLESNASGYFTFAGIIPGTYVIESRPPDFAVFARQTLWSIPVTFEA